MQTPCHRLDSHSLFATWDKTVVDRQSDRRSWVAVLRRLVEDKRIRKIFAFANNRYAGHAPDTVKQFFELCDKEK